MGETQQHTVAAVGHSVKMWGAGHDGFPDGQARQAAPAGFPGSFGKNYQPVFGIVGWINPPEDLLEARNGNGVAPAPKGNGAPTLVAEVEGEPEAIDPVDFSEHGDDF
jgi:hypothetical protein